MKDGFAKRFGLRLKAARGKQGMAQFELAQKLGIRAHHVSYYETGARLPNTERLADICRVLKISADELIKES